MKKQNLIPVVLLALSLLAAMPAHANNDPGYEQGKAALDNKDYATAYRIFKPLAEQGEAEAQNALGVLFQWGFGVAENPAEARKWYRLSAEQGLAKAQVNLGNLLSQSAMLAANSFSQAAMLKPDLVEAIKWYRMAAAQGNAEAEQRLGVLYYSGWGVNKDMSEAEKWTRCAAEKGNSSAQFNLGAMYAGGKVMPQDFTEAIKWYRLAAEQGDENARQALKQLGVK